MSHEVFMLAVMGDLAVRFGVSEIWDVHTAEAKAAAKVMTARQWVDGFARRFDLTPLTDCEGYDVEIETPEVTSWFEARRKGAA